MANRKLEEAKALIRLEYYEIPGLAVTFWQAQRLWNLSDELCERALLSLVRDQVLTMTPAGAFVCRAEPPLRVDAFGAPVADSE